MVRLIHTSNDPKQPRDLGKKLYQNNIRFKGGSTKQHEEPLLKATHESQFTEVFKFEHWY